MKLLSWDFIIGYKTVTDEDGKKSGITGVSNSVYPPKPVLNPAFLPDLTLTLPQATTQIMKNTQAKPTQEYIKLWKDLKAKGEGKFKNITFECILNYIYDLLVSR